MFKYIFIILLALANVTPSVRAEEAPSPVEICYNLSNFYYQIAITRDNGMPQTDLIAFLTDLAIKTDVPLSTMDKWINAVIYVYSVNSSPKQIAAGTFQECLSPTKKI